MYEKALAVVDAPSPCSSMPTLSRMPLAKSHHSLKGSVGMFPDDTCHRALGLVGRGTDYIGLPLTNLLQLQRQRSRSRYREATDNGEESLKLGLYAMVLPNILGLYWR